MLTYILFSAAVAAVFFALNFRRESWKSNLYFSAGVFVVVGLFNYFAMPVLAWGWTAWILEILIFSFIPVVVGNIYEYTSVNSEYDWNWDYEKRQDHELEVKKARRSMFLSIYLTLVPVLFLIVIGLASGEMCNSSKYNKMLDVEEAEYANFASDVDVIPTEKMIVADEAIARKVAEDLLEQDPGLGSRVLVGEMTLQNLNGTFIVNGQEMTFNDELVWVAPLEHSGFFKWLNNRVTPGYMIVYANNPNVRMMVSSVGGDDLKLKYLETSCFATDIERYLRTHGYASTAIAEEKFEINNEGRPYWVISIYEKTINGFGGKDAVGVITLDAQSGEIAEYGIEDAPAWIDRIQPEKFITNQIRTWGEYKSGYWNSIFAKIGVQEPTPGMVLVYSKGECFWYTGIQSAGSDGATSGFMLVNARTKKAKYYRVSGVNEMEAKRIAEDQQFAKASRYTATSPVLYNVRGIPSYFMTFTGESGNITGYAFVAVTSRQIVGCGLSKTETEANYLNALRRSNETIQGGAVEAVTKVMTVRDITSEGKIYYILFNEVKGKEFTASSEFFREVRWTKPGARVKVSYGENDNDVIPLDNFDNMDFEF